MRAPGDILLVSAYELGHPPHGIALAKAFLERAGFRPAALDLAVEGLDLARVQAARLAVLSVPMHTALRLGLAAAARIRARNPDALLAFHGHYAVLNAARLVRAGAAAVLGGECEEDLVGLAEAVERGEADLSRFVVDDPARVPVRRLPYPVPSREGLPPLARYARLDPGDGAPRLAGYVEATRGCKHGCRHCPIPAVYAGRFVAVPEELVLADVAAQVDLGARHVTFGDPDFLNGPAHALRIARALHARWPALTFDFTAKVEHLVAAPETLRTLAACGALFVTSAVESLDDRVLAALAKGHGRAEALRAFELCAEAGLALRPSLVPFTPWERLEGYLDLLETFRARGLVPQLDPVQLSIRLLVPRGSLLEGDPGIAFDGFDEEGLSWRWRHPDPRMDALQPRVAAAVEDGALRGAPAGETFDRVETLARAAAGLPHVHVNAPEVDPRRVPRMTESWFC